MKRLFTTIFLLSIGLGLAFGTVISGGTAIISTDQVWTKANSPYRIQDNVLIMENVTLEVEAGVEVIVDATYSLVVKGRMLCHGSETDPITFSPSPENLTQEWGGFSFEGGLDGTFGSTFTWVSLHRAQIGIKITGSGFHYFDHVTVEYCSLDGLNIFQGKTSLSYCKIQNNGRDGIYINAWEIFITHSTIKENARHGVAFQWYANNSHIFYSEITSNDIGIFLSYVYDDLPDVKYNHIHDNTTYDFYNNDNSTAYAMNNYWGVANTNEMNLEGSSSNIEKIYDFNDNADVGLVLYNDFYQTLDAIPTATPTPSPTETPTPTFTPTDIPIPTVTPTPIPSPTYPSISVNINDVTLEMAYIPAGTFMRGSPDNEIGRASDESPQHQVTLSKPFYMGKYEVTQSQWQAVMGSNPSGYPNENRPVEQINWYDIQNFIDKLNQLNVGTFRLPTEAEWEYACRAGTTTRFYWGEDLDETIIGEYVCYTSNSGSITQEVGTKLPNAWGLYDMNGNAWEWCQDWYSEYDSSQQIDPQGPETGTRRVFRGGGCYSFVQMCRSAFRNHASPDVRFNDFGFRLVMDDPLSTPTPTFTPTETLIPTITPTPTPIPSPTYPSISVNINDVTLEMAYIPAGTFMMGSPDSEQDRVSDEGPQHLVTISQPFYMGKYEVTQAQWEAVMGSNPSHWKGDNLPVEQVSWDDIQIFLQKLNQQGQGTFRLPTEAEWEYACRAGTTTRYYWGDDLDSSQIGQYAWYTSNSSGATHEIGQKLPNAWGLFDMSGNVWECCQDWYGSYGTSSQTDPTGPSSASYRVVRGGGWDFNAAFCRSARRSGNLPDGRYASSSFRLVMDDPLSTPTPTFTPTETLIPTITPTPTPIPSPTYPSISVNINDVTLEMAYIPAGTFMMGSPDDEPYEGPQHQVNLSTPFYMGKFEVTQAQWLSVMGSNPSSWKGFNLPVENVSWIDVQEFIQQLNQLGIGSFRLPTEAEWEYACRAGTSTRFYWGDDLDNSQIEEYAWYDANSSSSTHEVGQKHPNPWGLYDMSGNLQEWCQDWYGSYVSTFEENPTGPNTGTKRVVRGGSWYDNTWFCRSANRYSVSPDYPYWGGGFRLVMAVPTPTPIPTPEIFPDPRVEWIENENNGHVYALSPEPMTWFEAEALAIAYGGHLVTIDNEEENQWLLSKFSNHDSYIGLKRNESSDWIWADGTPIIYSNWIDSNWIDSNGGLYGRFVAYNSGKWAVEGNPATERYAIMEIPMQIEWILPQSYTLIKGDNAFLTQDTQWSKANSPYVIEDDVLIKSGATLFIEPGVDIFFKGKFSIYVEGTIQVIGTESEQITFTTLNSNFPYLNWGSIFILSENPFKMHWCKIHKSFDGINIRSNQNTQISNSSFSQCINRGASINTGNSILNECTFFGNGNDGLVISATFTNISNCIFSNNFGNGLNGSFYETTIYNSSFSNNKINGFRFGYLFNSLFYNNLVTGNQNNGIFSGDFGSNSSIFNCNIYNNKIYAVENMSSIVTISNTYWGPDTTAEMQTKGTSANISTIYDSFDDLSRGRVFYNGFLTSEFVPTPSPSPTPSPTPAPAARKLILPATMTAQPGTIFEIPVAVDNAQGILAYRIVLLYDSMAMSYIENSVTTADTLSQSFVPPVVSNQTGRLIISSAGSVPLPEDAGLLVKCRFRLTDNAKKEQAFPITFDAPFTLLNDGFIAKTVVDGTATTQSYLWGDLNSDSIAGGVDASLLLQYDAFLIQSFPAYPDIVSPAIPVGSDLNGDQIAGGMDASLLLQLDAFLIENFPVDLDNDTFGPEANLPVGKRMSPILAAQRTLSTKIIPYVNGYKLLQVAIDSLEAVQSVRIGLRYDPSQTQIMDEEIRWVGGDLYAVNHNADEGLFILSGVIQHPTPSKLLIEVPFLGQNPVVMDSELSRVNDGQILFTLQDDTTRIQDWMLTR